MLLAVERNSENVRNGRRSRGPSSNGHGASPDSTSDDDCKYFILIISAIIFLMDIICISNWNFILATKKVGNKSSKTKSEYKGKFLLFLFTPIFFNNMSITVWFYVMNCLFRFDIKIREVIATIQGQQKKIEKRVKDVYLRCHTTTHTNIFIW